MAPGKYKDVAKSANDLLNSDYKFVKSLKLKSKSSNGFDFTCESKLGAAVSSSLSTKFSPAANVTVDKLQVNTDGRVVVESSLKNAVKGMTFKFAAEDGSSKGASGKEYTPQGSLSVDYCADKVTVNSKLDVVNGPTLSVSALTGHGGFVFGGTMTYNTQFDADGKSGAVTNYGGAVGYKTSDFTGSLLASKKCSVFDLSLFHAVNRDVKIGAITSYAKKSGATSLTLGGSYALDNQTELQGKLGSCGNLSLNWIQQLSPKVQLTTSASVDVVNIASDTHKFGLGLVIG